MTRLIDVHPVRLLTRLMSTATMLAQVALSYRRWAHRSRELSEQEIPAARDAIHRLNARRFTDTSLRHGGAFLKVGQLLSARSDMLPAPWIEILSELQDQALPESIECMRRVLSEELGASPESAFASFEAEPLASASIGQVHRAVLKDGRTVAVKIQRPGLNAIIRMDIFMLRYFLASIRSLLPSTDIDTIADEVQRAVLLELDYRKERESMVKARNLLAGNAGMIVPRTVDELCTRRVLVSEFVAGEKLTTALDKRQAAGDHEGLSIVLERTLEAYFCQVLRGGFFQADPHPGNLLVTTENVVVLLDFGCTMELPEHFRTGYAAVLMAAIRDDRETIGRMLLQLGFETRSGKPDTLIALANALLAEIRAGALSGGKGGIHWPTREDFARRANEVLGTARNDPVTRVPPEIVMLARVFSTLNGLFNHYRPDMNVAGILMPHLIPAARASAA